MKSYEQYCGLALALDHVGDRWTLLIVRELLAGPKRFSDLVSALPGIATNLLTERLRSLEADDLVSRRILPPPAASHVYELTDSGEDLRESVEALLRWGGRFMVERTPTQSYSPEWLPLALEALIPPPGIPDGDHLTVDVRLPEGSVRLHLDSSGVRLESDHMARTDVTLSGPAPIILGLAAGAIGARTAHAALALEGTRASVRLVERWLRSGAGGTSRIRA